MEVHATQAGQVLDIVFTNARSQEQRPGAERQGTTSRPRFPFEPQINVCVEDRVSVAKCK